LALTNKANFALAPALCPPHMEEFIGKALPIHDPKFWDDKDLIAKYDRDLDFYKKKLAEPKTKKLAAAKTKKMRFNLVPQDKKQKSSMRTKKSPQIQRLFQTAIRTHYTKKDQMTTQEPLHSRPSPSLATAAQTNPKDSRRISQPRRNTAAQHQTRPQTEKSMYYTLPPSEPVPSPQPRTQHNVNTKQAAKRKHGAVQGTPKNAMYSSQDSRRKQNHTVHQTTQAQSHPDARARYYSAHSSQISHHAHATSYAARQNLSSNREINLLAKMLEDWYWAGFQEGRKFAQQRRM